jgi:hypothetical protein
MGFCLSKVGRRGRGFFERRGREGYAENAEGERKENPFPIHVKSLI